MKSLLLGLAFLLELVAFISFSAFGYLFHMANVLKLLSFIILFVVLIIFWSIFMAPKAPNKFDSGTYYVAKTIIYAISAITLFGLRGVGVGVAFVALALVDEPLLFKHNTSK